MTMGRGRGEKEAGGSAVISIKDMCDKEQWGLYGVEARLPPRKTRLQNEKKPQTQMPNKRKTLCVIMSIQTGVSQWLTTL